MTYVIGVDLGGTQIRAALLSATGQIVHETNTSTRANEGPQAVIDRVVEQIANVRAALPTDAALAGIGIGSPGPLDPHSGVVFNPPNLPGWENVPLRAIVQQRTGLPVELGNDANAAALGEWLFGGGVGTRNMLYLTISTGIGSGVICDGCLLLGHNGSAGEAGLHIIDWRTGQTWEQLASGTGFARRAAAAMPTDPASALHALATPATITSALVAQAAAAGDRLAQALMDEEADLLGIGLVNVLHLYSPELILLGGSVVTNNPALLVRAQQVVQQRALPIYRSVPIRLAALGDRVGVLGAAALWLNAHQAR
jgi:glucokinase